ncbi:MAG: DUF1365 domain-containing protein [Betaproteobacteria bacterium]|nr:DUF1365 domain-containing protein [Betaproteobacteria bacterium]
MHSALYTGSLRHRRFVPRPREFRYRLFMAWLDLAELDQVFRGRWFWSARRPALAWLRRADYLGDPAVPLDQAVRERVTAQTGRRPAGPIRLLAHLRMFGHCFNPVSFYYCYDAAGDKVETIVAEITNTPWNERHAYVLQAGGGELRFRFGKAFHVSPFLPMALHYDWRFSEPGARLAVHMRNLEGEAKVFDATLDLARREIGTASLAGALARFPLMPLQVVAAIYWQALRLWTRRTPFYAHP